MSRSSNSLWTFALYVSVCQLALRPSSLYLYYTILYTYTTPSSISILYYPINLYYTVLYTYTILSDKPILYYPIIPMTYVSVCQLVRGGSCIVFCQNISFDFDLAVTILVIIIDINEIHWTFALSTICLCLAACTRT